MKRAEAIWLLDEPAEIAAAARRLDELRDALSAAYQRWEELEQLLGDG